MMEQIRADLVGSRVVIWDVEAANKLYKNGFYGKPLGIRKVKDLEFNAPLELSLIEAVYLCKNKTIKIYEDGRELSCDELIEKAEKWFTRFRDIYHVYEDLRLKGYIIKPGLKFGTTFTVYKYGPGIDHAPFLVHVFQPETTIDPIEIVRAGRLSHSVKKKFIIACINQKTREINYYVFKWWKA
jgi:tRNA-intron endonuclease